MLKRMIVVWGVASALLAWSSAPAGERPTSETIRAAAAAARAAVVDVEVKGRPLPGGMHVLPDVRIFPPGEVLPQPPGGRREWRWQWPPRGDQPNVPEIPHWLQMPGHGGPSKGAGTLLSVEGDRGLVAVPESLVRGTKAATVRLADGRELKGKVLGADPATGTACIEIRGKKLAAAKAAKPEAVDVGDWVLALGGPASGKAVTIGIISAKDRPGAGQMAGTQVLLTDAFVTDAMAGSPVVNLRGEVVGMALAVGGNRGTRRRELTSVVPIATVQATVTALARDGRVRRGFLGTTYGPVAPEEQARLGIKGGVRVQEVVPGQGAAKAGMQPGDVIVEVGGKKVAGADAFRGLVQARRPGETVAFKVLRGGEERFVEVTLGEQPDEAVQEEPADPPPPLPVEPIRPIRPVPKADGEKLPIGVTIQPLTPELAEQFGFGADKGLLVTGVDPESPAAKARPHPLRTGDLLKEIGRKPVATVEAAKALLKELAGQKAKTALLLVRGRDGTRYVVIDLPR